MWFGYPYIWKYCIFYYAEEWVIQVWNDSRVRKWRKVFHFKAFTTRARIVNRNESDRYNFHSLFLFFSIHSSTENQREPSRYTVCHFQTHFWYLTLDILRWPAPARDRRTERYRRLPRTPRVVWRIRGWGTTFPAQWRETAGVPKRERDIRTTQESVEKDCLGISKWVLKFIQSFAGKLLINVLKRSFCASVCAFVYTHLQLQ